MGERSTSVDLFFVFPSQWPARAQHGWVEAIRKGWDGAGQLAGAERERGDRRIKATAKRRRGAGAEDQVPGRQAGRQGAGAAA